MKKRNETRKQRLERLCRACDTLEMDYSKAAKAYLVTIIRNYFIKEFNNIDVLPGVIIDGLVDAILKNEVQIRELIDKSFYAADMKMIISANNEYTSGSYNLGRVDIEKAIDVFSNRESSYDLSELAAALKYVIRAKREPFLI